MPWQTGDSPCECGMHGTLMCDHSASPLKPSNTSRTSWTRTGMQRMQVLTLMIIGISNNNNNSSKNNNIRNHIERRNKKKYEDSLYCSNEDDNSQCYFKPVLSNWAKSQVKSGQSWVIRGSSGTIQQKNHLPKIASC